MPVASDVLEGASIVVAGSAAWTDSLVRTLATYGAAPVRTVDRVDEATDACRTTQPDCLVTGLELVDGTGIDLLESVRAECRTLPMVCCTPWGDEQIASEAISAGVTAYIPMDGPAEEIDEEVPDRIARAVEKGLAAADETVRAHQFDAVFRHTETATWVLDGRGRLVRANETARGFSGDGAGGERFWDLPLWGTDERTRTDIEAFVRAVLDRSVPSRVVAAVATNGSEKLELSALPVSDATGDLTGIVVEGNDVTERTSLYRNLRESEELHRVTLNNMTDTVLVTDDDGSFTYICPNVHFIFGYTVAEIRDLGTIDELLGADLFDREALCDAGVLTNIECETVDKSGTEHTLLVNVRTVDIQGGTTLYSCRDVTKRKQREEALVSLQGMARSLLYAESEAEIAEVLVGESTEILGLSANAIYLYDQDENVLRPSAWTDPFETRYDSLSPVPVGDETAIGHSFLKAESLFLDDRHRSAWAADATSEVRSVAYVPLGRHGVLIAGSTTPNAFDRIRRELADLLAATAEAALDRVEREGQLRIQDRTLKRQNRRLSQLNDVNELIRDIERVLVAAESRADVDRTVCEVLADSTHFSFAWIGEPDRAGTHLQPTAWAGEESGYLDRVDRSIEPAASEPACRTAMTREPTVVENVAASRGREDWANDALAHGHLSAVAVPLVYEEFVYGVLAVYADSTDVFDEMIRDVLVELGELVASAISGLNQTNALLTTTATRITFETEDEAFTLSKLAGRAGCSVTFDGGVRQTSDGSIVIVSVRCARADAVAEAARTLLAVESASVLNEADAAGVVQLRLNRPFLAQVLADHGAVLERVEAEPSGAELVVDVPSNVDTRPIVRHVQETLPDAEVVAKYTTEGPSGHDLYATVLDQVTDRQLEVVQAAYYAGFFETPREQTGKAVAESLDISPTAFYNHTRTVQRKLFAALFDDIGVHSVESS